MSPAPPLATTPEQYDRAARELLDEPVLACAPCTRRPGAPGSLPPMFLAAATACRLHLLAQPRIRWSPAPRAVAVLASVPLAGARIALEPAPLGTRVTIAAAADDDPPVEIHVTKGVAGDRLVARLARAG